ncbi:MAG: hypothetical protein AAF065_10710 [Verrucomicrobiota bacterium]
MIYTLSNYSICRLACGFRKVFLWLSYSKLVILFLSSNACLHALNITSSANSISITSITFDDNGSTVVQSSPSGADDNDPEPVLLDLMNLQGGTVLDEFNTGVVTAIALNFTPSPGFDAYLDNQTISSTDTDFAEAVRVIYSDRNLRNYVNKNSSANANNPNGDYDILYEFALSNDDYIIVAERSGNSAISIQAIDENAIVIPGSETLNFVGGGNAPFTWDTGYRSDQDPNSNQTLELAVVDVRLFNTNDNIFGLRVINNSGADNKILVASEDTFANNIPNPGATLFPLFTVLKFAQVDDGNSDPGDDFYVPGAEIIYRVVVTNGGPGIPDSGTFVFSDDLPDEVDLFVGDFAGGGGGPIDFDDGSEPSNLGFSPGSVIYRNVGGTAISPGTSGYNELIRSFEIPFTGSFEPWDGSGPQPNFEIEYRVRLK